MTIIRSNSISGINSITAAPGANLQFFDSTGASLSLDTGNVNAGVLTATTVRVTGDLTVEGTTTTLDTIVTEVDKLEVSANNSTVGVAITQSGAGDILRLYDGASQVVTVDDEGNFGIKTTNPTQALTLRGEQIIETNSTAADSGNGIYWQSTTNGWNTGQAHAAIFGKRVDANNGYFRIDVREGGTTSEKLRITNTGNIGIGTDNPGRLLNLYGATTPIVRLTHTTASSYAGLEVYEGTTQKAAFNALGSTSSAYGGSNAIQVWNFVDAPIVFATNNSERLRISSDGDLLSNTGGSATYDDITGESNAGLVIGSNSYLSSGIVVRTSGLGTCRLYFADNSGDSNGRRVGSIEYNHNNDQLAFTAGGSNTMNMYAGNVRISGPGSTSGTSQSPLAVSSNLGTITAFFGAQTSVTGLTASQYSAAIRFNGADVAWGDIAYFPNGESEYGSFRFGRHGSTISSYPSASIGVNKVYTTGGIDFKTTTEASGMTSELFDDYEEGTFTPTIRGSVTTGTATGTIRGQYIKIGHFVHCQIRLNNVNFSGSSGNIIIENLPYNIATAPNSEYSMAAAAMMYNVSFNTSYKHGWYMNPGTSRAYGILSRSGLTWADWPSSEFHSSSIYMNQTLTYMAA